MRLTRKFAAALVLGIFLVLAVVVGVVAAVLPARRAAGTRILEAIQYE